MRNYIDNLFFKLIEEIKNKNIYDIYIHMVNKFKKIPFVTQKSMENYFNKFDYWGKMNIDNDNFQIFYLKSLVFKENLEDYVWLYNRLSDYKSKYILFSILNNFYNFDFINLKNCMENIYKQYFDLDLMPKCEDEVFVDVGTFTGDTVIDYLNSYGEDSYNKIYCYEISDDNIKKIEKNLASYSNIIVKQKAIADKNSTLYFDQNIEPSANKISANGNIAIEADSLDNDVLDKITLVKMDIEGGERLAIEGMKNHIKNDSPKLLIAVYHNNTDLFEIPKLIEKYNDNYDFHLRYYGGCIYPTEICLICLPKK